MGASRQRWRETVRPVVLLALFAAIVVPCRTAITVRAGDFALFIRAAQEWPAASVYAPLMADGNGVNLNVPLMTLAFVPLTWLPPWAAITLWSAINVACMIGAWWLLAREGFAWELVALGLMVPMTGPLSLLLGQVTGLLLLASVGAWLASRHGRPSLCGALIGLLIAVKPFFGVWLGLWVLRREWRALLWAVVTAGSSVVLTVLAWPELALGWVSATRNVSWLAHIYNASIFGVAARWFHGVPAGVYSRPGLTPLWFDPSAERAVVAIGVILIVSASGWAVSRASHDGAWAITGLASVLLSPLGWIYYLPLVLAPALVLLPVPAMLPALLALSIPDDVLPATLGRWQTATLANGYAIAVFGLWIMSMRHRGLDDATRSAREA